MDNMPRHMNAEHWIRHIFSSKSARDGGVVRRKVRDVERIIGSGAFEAEVRRRGYRAVQNGQHYVVFCNAERLRLIE
ncbi:N-(5'-phosphoribosyl)anthranilate isomerase [Sulfitobacter aestuariivivens]|uniref:N-(5'-phosphoribosyl)anthranilate isomerase n=2 Tax=Sulfitobacter aestuariivivens TaxID=2766981 RepID=A0A927HG69_9RHOB|nr:N-(5'-phosphoribosyl)anthranilate isomerase [Sulfitobacter aestuariivivens]